MKDGAGSGSPAPGRVLIALAVLVHLTIVASILAQPLDVNSGPPEGRSLVWRLFNDTVHRRGPGADFFAVYHAGVKVWRGEDPYDLHEDPAITPYYYPFRYLPGVATTLGVAFGALEPRTAYIAWSLILEALLAGVIALLWWRAQASWLRVFGTLTLLLSAPYFLELHMGQFSFATVSCLALALVLVESAASPRAPAAWVAAGAFAVAALLKVFPLITLPAIVKRRTGILCGVVAAAVLSLANLPGFFRHPGLLRAFMNANFVAPSGGFDSGNHGLFYLLYMVGKDLGISWASYPWQTWAAVLQVALLLPASGLVLLSRHPSTPTLGGGLLILGHTLTYVHVWEHHSSGVLVAALLMLGALVGGERRSSPAGSVSWTILLAAGSVVLLALPTPFAVFDRALDVQVLDPSTTWPPVARYVMPLCKSLPMVVLFVLGGRELARSMDAGAA